MKFLKKANLDNKFDNKKGDGKIFLTFLKNKSR